MKIGLTQTPSKTQKAKYRTELNLTRHEEDVEIGT